MATGASISRAELLHWLREEDAAVLEQLWQQADSARREHVGDAVHLRGLVEISNHCRRQCAYCGIRAGNGQLERYRMSMAEIRECVLQAVEYGYGTVVLQSGEDLAFDAAAVTELLNWIKSETPLAVTLSLGEREPGELEAWRRAGADRYLLRFETSDPALYAAIHPGPGGQPGKLEDRLNRLRQLRELGYEVGSGVMIGIPGQSYSSLADDLLLFRELDLDMIGVGPYIEHPDTPLARGEVAPKCPPEEQAPATELMGLKVLALTRLVCPEANLPSTTALASLNQDSGRELGLARGANIVMPNLTPLKYRSLYEIYPAKACLGEDELNFSSEIADRIRRIGRTVGTGPGGRLGVRAGAEPDTIS